MEVRRIFSQNQKKLAKSFRVCASGELEETAFGQTFPANIAGKPTTKTRFFCFTVRYPCFPTSDSVSTQPGSQSGCGFQYTFCKLPPLSSACASLSANLCIPFRPNTISWNGFPPRDSFNQCTIRKKSDSVPPRLFLHLCCRYWLIRALSALCFRLCTRRLWRFFFSAFALYGLGMTGSLPQFNP